MDKTADNEIKRAPYTHTEAEVDRIRTMMRHPPGARKTDDNGVRSWVKPPAKTPTNIEVAILQDPWLSQEFTFNTLTQTVLWRGEPLLDHHITKINLMMDNTYKLVLPDEVYFKVIYALAREHWSVNPLREYLEGLVWDGIPRLDELFLRSTGCKDTPLNRVLGRRWAVSAVARAMRPGCKMDTMLVLLGEQGGGKEARREQAKGKSTWVEVMFSGRGDKEFYTDTRFDLDSKDAMMGMQGVWGWEVAEMDSFFGKSANKIKAHLSSASDRYRRPYLKQHEVVPRSCVFVGTTNDQRFLSDPTGDRRFWVISCSKFNIDWLTEHRDLLWAEAVDLFAQGERWWLGGEEEDEMDLIRQDHKVDEEPWIEAFVDIAAALVNTPGTSRNGVSIESVLEQLNIKLKGNSDLLRLDRRHVMKGADALRERGWVGRRIRMDGVRKHLWLPDGVEPREGIIESYNDARVEWS
jgi:predicted P-loop ATPase